MKKGTIFDLKEFAIYDGPGIRQTVFFKGCPLRCNWCHNPEGLHMSPELIVSAGSCRQCGACENACKAVYPNAACPTCPPSLEPTHTDIPQSTVQLSHTYPYHTSACQTCGACIPVCPLNLRHITGERLTSDELVSRIRKNSDYYARYGGGVTFSGGEPLMQAEFLMEVLDKIPDLHRALETSGYCASDVFEQVIQKLDFIMMDIKIFDSDLHKTYTGVDNQLILQNAKILCRNQTPFVIRIPVIPGVNDNEDNFRQTAQWIKDAPALQKVELLPYHKTAGAKYTMLNQSYKPMFDPDRQPWTSTDIFQQYSIRSDVL